MKKLLTVLSTVSMLTVAGGSVVACGSNKYDQKDDDGNSILIDGLGNLDFKDGTTSIDSNITTQNILDQIIANNGDSALRGKIVSRFINLFSAGFLKNGADNVASVSDNPYLIDGLKDQLNTAYTELEESVDSDIKDERDDYDDQYGKKAADKWKDMLEAKFPGITNLDELEAKYKADKMLNDEDDNVNTRLLNILLNTNQQGITWTEVGTIKDYLDDWYNSSDRDQWVKDNISKAQQIIWSALPEHNYAGKLISGDKLDDAVATFNDTIKIENPSVKADEDRDDTDTDGTDDDYQAYKALIKYSAPTSIDKFESGSNYAASGFLSNSQRFFLDSYYKKEAPIAISQVTIKFADNGSMDNGINYEEDFYSKNPGTDDVDRIEDINKFLTNINENMNDILTGTTFDQVTNKAVSSLMTLSNSTDFSQMERNIVYKYINDNKDGSTLAPGPDGLTAEGDDSTNIEELVGKLDRTKNATGKTDSDAGTTGTMYTVLGDGLLAYIDSDGLQIVRIEGYDLLQKSWTTADNGTNEGILGIDSDTKKIAAKTAEELGYFNEYDKLKTAEKVTAIQSQTSDNDLYNKLNSSVTNPYLHYLVNQSLLKGVDSSVKTSFDIMESVKSYVKISQPESSGQYTYWTALMDYFLAIQGAKTSTPTADGTDGSTDQPNDYDDLFAKYFKVGNDDENSTAQRLFKYAIGWIKSIKTQELNDNTTKFMAAQETENKAIEDNTNENYPKGEIAAFDGETLKDLLKVWTPYADDASNNDDDEDLVDPMSFAIGNDVVETFFKGGWM